MVSHLQPFFQTQGQRLPVLKERESKGVENAKVQPMLNMSLINYYTYHS